jgi:hypothetical protein
VVRVLVTATRDPHKIQLERRAIGRPQIRVKGLTHRMHLQPCCGRKGPSFCAAKEFLSTGKSHDGAKIIAEDAQTTDVGIAFDNIQSQAEPHKAPCVSARAELTRPPSF